MKCIYVVPWRIRSMTHKRKVVLTVSRVMTTMSLFSVYDKDPCTFLPETSERCPERRPALSMSKANRTMEPGRNGPWKGLACLKSQAW